MCQSQSQLLDCQIRKFLLLAVAALISSLGAYRGCAAKLRQVSPGGAIVDSFEFAKLCQMERKGCFKEWQEDMIAGTENGGLKRQKQCEGYLSL